MKYIISIFIVSALSALSFRVNDRMEFVDFFKLAFSKSYEGLENMRDPGTGTWEFEKAIGDFNACEIHYDLQRGVHGINFITVLESESTAAEFMNRYDEQILGALPETYKRNQKECVTGKKIVYEYSGQDISARAKNPVVQMEVINKGTASDMVITLFEPLNRTEPDSNKK